VWEFFPGAWLYKRFDFGSFGPVEWASTYLIAVLITTLVESAAAKFFFSIDSSRNNMLVVFLANAASVGIVFVFIFAFPVQNN
jgi:hypothetical protein